MANKGSFRKGEKRPGQGKHGSPKNVLMLRDMILKALDKAGGEDYLFEQATKNPTAFMSLIGKVLPMQVTGAGDGPLVVEIVRYSDKSNS